MVSPRATAGSGNRPTRRGIGERLSQVELALFGGPVTGPGYDFHSLVATAGVSQRVELQFPVPFPGISLGRFGRSPGQLTLAPYANAVVLGGPLVHAWRRDDMNVVGGADRPVSPPDFPGRGVHSSLGIGVHGLFDLLRLPGLGTKRIRTLHQELGIDDEGDVIYVS